MFNPLKHSLETPLECDFYNHTQINRETVDIERIKGVFPSNADHVVSKEEIDEVRDLIDRASTKSIEDMVKAREMYEAALKEATSFWALKECLAHRDGVTLQFRNGFPIEVSKFEGGYGPQWSIYVKGPSYRDQSKKRSAQIYTNAHTRKDLCVKLFTPRTNLYSDNEKFLGCGFTGPDNIVEGCVQFVATGVINAEIFKGQRKAW